MNWLEGGLWSRDQLTCDGKHPGWRFFCPFRILSIDVPPNGRPVSSIASLMEGFVKTIGIDVCISQQLIELNLGAQRGSGPKSVSGAKWQHYERQNATSAAGVIMGAAIGAECRKSAASWATPFRNLACNGSSVVRQRFLGIEAFAPSAHGPVPYPVIQQLVAAEVDGHLLPTQIRS